MDVNRVIGEVAARHGVRLDPDDPALVLVTVAEMMLAEAREEFLASARQATAEFVEAAGRVQEETGATLAHRAEEAARKLRHKMVGKPSTESAPDGAPLRLRDQRAASQRPLVGLLIGILSFLAGVLIGRRIAP